MRLNMTKSALVELYQQACKLLKKGDVLQAQVKFNQIKKIEPNYRSVNYFLARCKADLDGPADDVYDLLAKHLATNTAKNRVAAYQLGLKIALQAQDKAKFEQILQQAKKEQITGLAKFERAFKQLDAKKQLRLKFKFIQFAKSKTPIAQTSAPKYRAYKFFINGMTPVQKQSFTDGKWHEFAVTTPKALEFKGYMACTIKDERKYYRKFLPDLPDAFLRKMFNDYLEEDEFFKTKWEKSRVFSLLQVPVFERHKIAELLELNELLDETARRHLQGCEDLVELKKAGECLPLSEANKFKELELLQDFGYICAKNCGQTIHLADKCQFERDFKRALQKKSRKKLPFKHPAATYRPTREQLLFMQWLAQNKALVVNLLGVGGSGKTHTLGQILDPRKTLALAPTHKARLNLAQHGFYHNDTLQHVIYELENGNESVITDYEVVILDEVSMAPLELLAKLVTSATVGVRYLLVGDEKQLPPVTQDEDALSVCGDALELIKAYGSCFYFRANLRCKNQALNKFIWACRTKDLANLATSTAFQTATVKEMLNDKFKHQALEECMILAYRNHTVGLINQQFYRLLAQNKPHVPFYFQNGFGRGGFFVGAQVVFYHNDDNYQNYGYTNSEFGKVTALNLVENEDKSTVTVETEVKKYVLPLSRARKDLFLAYALTIHKAQGSGANKVYVLEADDYGLAYTAVSRTKQELYFVKMTREMLLDALQKETPRKQNISLEHK